MTRNTVAPAACNQLLVEREQLAEARAEYLRSRQARLQQALAELAKRGLAVGFANRLETATTTHGEDRGDRT